MPRTANPFYSADAAGLAPVGQGLTNLASVFAPPSAADRMTADQMGWQTKAMQDELLNASRKREGQMMLGDVVSGWEYGKSDPRHLAATALQYGVPVQDIGDLYRVMSGNFDGATDETRMGALVGSGKMPGTDTSVSIGRQNELLGKKYGASQDELRMQLEAQRKKEQGLMSTDQLLAQVFQQDGHEAADRARIALKGPPSGKAPVDPWLQAGRRSDVEVDVAKAIDTFASDMGGSPENFPSELRAKMLGEAMDRIEAGEAPRTAVGDLFNEYAVQWEDNNFFNIFAPNDRFVYDRKRAGSAQPPAAPTPPPAAPAPAGAGAPPVNQRVPGQVYNTPRGRMIWATDPATGDAGWVAAEG